MTPETITTGGSPPKDMSTEDNPASDSPASMRGRARGHLGRTARPVLRLLPSAWLKLQYLCHAGGTEVGGFGITAPGDLLLVTDFRTVAQDATAFAVRFRDAAVADFYDACVDDGLRPAEFARVWCHTHPGHSPQPSGKDEETFARRFSDPDWAVMLILARGGRTFCRLRFNVGPGADLDIAVKVLWDALPEDAASVAAEAWRREYLANVHPLPPTPLPTCLDVRVGGNAAAMDRRTGRVVLPDTAVLGSTLGPWEDLACDLDEGGFVDDGRIF